MLRISKLADYAILILSELAKGSDQLASASVLAKNLGLSLPVVSKILKLLAQASLLSSMRGSDGGYRLARLAEEISLAEVVAAIEGTFSVTECCTLNGSCVLDASCSTKKNWKTINQVIFGTLSKVSLKDMMGPLDRLGESANG